MKLSTRLILGFGAVVLLLLIISVVSFISIRSIVSDFDRYEKLAEDANLAGRVQANLLKSRLDVKDFLMTRKDEHVTEFKKNFKATKGFLDEMKGRIKNPERKKKVNEMDSIIGSYETAFDEIVVHNKNRDKIVYENMDKIGLDMRTSCSHIVEDAKKGGLINISVTAGELQENILLARLYVMKYLDANKKEDIERVIKELKNNAIEHIDELGVLIKNPELLKYLEEVKKDRLLYLKEFDELTNAIDSRNKIIDTTLNPVGEKIAGLIEDVKLSIKADQDQLAIDVNDSSNLVMLIVIVMSIISILIAIALTILITNQVKKPLGGEPVEIAKITERIAKGDLTITFDNRKITGLMLSMKHMVDNLKDMVINIDEVSSHLAASSEELTSSAQSLSDGAQGQAASIEETGSSLEELNASIQEVNKNAKEVAQKSTNLEKISRDSQELIDETVVGMKKIQDSSAKIEEIIGVINDIADQTNLLSLNASIEAARAGEHGRGFAVVAEEISKLADRSATSTKEVASLVKESLENVTNGVSLVNKSGEAFVEIYEDVRATVSLIEGIVNAIEQQTEGADQVQNAMNQINEVTQSVSASAEEMSSSTMELQNQAENLREIINQFKIDNRKTKSNITSKSIARKEEVGITPIED